MASRLPVVSRLLLPPLASIAISDLVNGRSNAKTSHCQCEKPRPKHKDRLIFIGTGSSTGCPRPLCPMIFQESKHDHAQLKKLREKLESACTVSNLAIQGNPKHNPNYRNNPSLVMAFTDPQGIPRHIVIDAGKTFREAALRWFPERNVTSLDAVILTHEHADAAFGLDDIRGMQQAYSNSKGQREQVPVPVYLSQDCLSKVAVQFPWLFPHHQSSEEEYSAKSASRSKKGASVNPPDKIKRHVASLDVHVLKPFKPVDIYGLEVVPLPVMHGEDLVCYGYAFTIGSKRVVYLSDISRMLPETLEYILRPPSHGSNNNSDDTISAAGSCDILIIDALHPGQKPHPVHYNLQLAMALANQLKCHNPDMATYIVGINCDSFPPHQQANAEFAEEYGNVQLAHDGLVIPCS